MPPKRHHYLSQFYLEGFAAERSLICVYDQQRKQLRRQTPINTAVRKHFYTINLKDGEKGYELERMLAWNEGFAKDAIGAIDRGKKLTDHQRVHLALFIALLATRTPRFDAMYRADIKESLLARNREWASDLDGLRQRVKEYEERTGNSIESVEDLQASLLNDKVVPIIPRNWALHGLMEVSFRAGRQFTKMKWTCLRAPPGATFITSDDPFMLLGGFEEFNKVYFGLGVGLQGAIRFIPLTAQTALFISDGEPSYGEGELREDEVDMLNLRLASQSDRFLFSPDEDYLGALVRDFKWSVRATEPRPSPRRSRHSGS